jgi:hypothetical protein
MSNIESACQIISSVGCFADLGLEVTDPEYFANIDRLNRIHAAAGELWDFVEDGLGDGHGAELLRKVRCLIAPAMVEQQKFDEQEYAWPMRSRCWTPPWSSKAVRRERAPPRYQALANSPSRRVRRQGHVSATFVIGGVTKARVVMGMTPSDWRNERNNAALVRRVLRGATV